MRRWLLVALLLAVPSVAAHAEPYQSDPASGARLDESPSTIKVSFTEPVFDDGSWIRVLDSDGNRVDNDDLRIEGQGRPDMTVTVPSLPDGAYSIAWQTYSVTDGHTVRGSIGFAIGGFAPPAAEVQAESAFDIVPSVARTLLYAGFSAAIGALCFAAWMRTPPNTGLLLAGAGLALAGTMALVWDTWQGTGLTLETYLESSGGRRMTARVWMHALIAVVTVAAGRVSKARRPGAWMLGLLWGVAAYQTARWGHITQQGRWGVWLELAHLVAASAWIGGLVAFMLYLRAKPSDWQRAGRHFGKLAGTAVAVIAATGLTLSVLLLKAAWAADPMLVWQDSWTWFLTAKLLAVAVMLGAAAMNRYGYLVESPPKLLARWVPRQEVGGIRRVVQWEAGTGTIALIAAGMLLSVSPPQYVDADTNPLQLTAQGDVFTGLLEVTPAPTVGASHTLRFYVNDADADEPVTNNTCGRDDCIKTRWRTGDDAGTEQEAAARPEGGGWWVVEPVLFTQAGNVTVSLDVQTGYVYLDTITFEAFAVAPV